MRGGVPEKAVGSEIYIDDLVWIEEELLALGVHQDASNFGALRAPEVCLRRMKRVPTSTFASFVSATPAERSFLRT